MVISDVIKVNIVPQNKINEEKKKKKKKRILSFVEETEVVLQFLVVELIGGSHLLHLLL